MKVLAPAKVNLSLEVRGLLPNGYHEITSIMQTIDLCDILSFYPSSDIEITSDLANWRAQESLVSKAVELLRGKSPRGVRIEVQKRIPLSSGLGGDSSDAAATLLALNSFWGLDLPGEELRALAIKLGSDVPFFIHKGTALVEGYGEKVTTLPGLGDYFFVLLFPDIPVGKEKTKRIYNLLSSEDYSDGSFTNQLLSRIKSGSKIESKDLFNALGKVAFRFFDGLEGYKMAFPKPEEVQVSGSGPTLFTIEQDKLKAESLTCDLRIRGFNAHFAGVFR